MNDAETDYSDRFLWFRLSMHWVTMRWNLYRYPAVTNLMIPMVKNCCSIKVFTIIKDLTFIIQKDEMDMNKIPE